MGNASSHHWDVIYRSAWIAVAMLLAIGLVCVFVPRFQRLSELQRRKEMLQDKLRVCEDQSSELRRKQERFRTEPAFVEKVAREDGYIKPNELVFKYTNRVPQTATEAVGGGSR